MASIDRTRPSSTPTETRNRDREVESLKDEVKSLNESHQAEISRLQVENKKRVDQVETDSNAKLNEKDMQHQKEIESIRAMYAKKTGSKNPGS